MLYQQKGFFIYVCIVIKYPFLNLLNVSSVCIITIGVYPKIASKNKAAGWNKLQLSSF